MHIESSHTMPIQMTRVGRPELVGRLSFSFYFFPRAGLRRTATGFDDDGSAAGAGGDSSSSRRRISSAYLSKADLLLDALVFVSASLVGKKSPLVALSLSSAFQLLRQHRQ